MEIIFYFSIGISVVTALIALYSYSLKRHTVWLIVFIALIIFACARLLLRLLHIEVSEFFLLVIDILLLGIFVYALRIFRDYEKTSTYLKALWDIDRAILTSLTPQNIIGAIEKRLLEITDCNALTIYKIGKNGTSLETFANYNVKREFHKQILEGNSEFIWQLISSKKCSVLECPCSGKNSGFSKVLDEFGFQSCLGVPLVLRGVPLGSLLLLTEKKKNYIKKDIQLIEGIARQLVIAMERIQTIEKIKEMNVESVLALVQAIEMRDPCTKGHSLSVANMAKEIAEKLDMSAKELELIEFAGLLHDVGKIVVSEDILQKPGPLSNEEWLIMKKHPLYSAEIIKPVKNLSDISEWIKYHHERWDGSGYPEGLKGETIPIYSRILAICDAYSAMTEKRPYRDGFTKDQAQNEIMENSGKQFDPEIVEIFVKYLEDPS